MSGNQSSVSEIAKEISSGMDAEITSGCLSSSDCLNKSDETEKSSLDQNGLSNKIADQFAEQYVVKKPHHIKSISTNDSALRQTFNVLSLSKSMKSNSQTAISISDSASDIRSNDQRLLWSALKSKIQRELDRQIFNAYIEPLSLSFFDSIKGEAIVSAPSKLVCEHVERKFLGRIRSILCELAVVSEMRIGLRVDQQKIDQPDNNTAVVKRFKQPEHKKPLPVFDSSLSCVNPRYTFSNFVVGSNSQFCHAAARQVADGPGKSYNPLFIYGGVGLGKTHLLHAIGNSILESNPSTSVLYMSAETFMSDLIQALRCGKMEEFKNRLRKIEVLLIDDIQFIAGKERTQEEFFHTFNALYNSKHQIVITSDRIPQDITGIEERLRTRFVWGLIADMQAPDFETRVAIINRKASLDNFSIPEDVAHYIAENVSSNVRELEGALTRLHAVSSLQSTAISTELAKNVLSLMFKPKSVNISVDDIKGAVANHFGLKISDLSSKRRTRNLSFPRHVAMYLCRKHTTASYPEIGLLFGGRDHSSVIHAANVVARKIDSTEEVRVVLEEIEHRLKNS